MGFQGKSTDLRGLEKFGYGLVYKNPGEVVIHRFDSGRIDYSHEIGGHILIIEPIKLVKVDGRLSLRFRRTQSKSLAEQRALMVGHHSLSGVSFFDGLKSRPRLEVNEDETFNTIYRQVDRLTVDGALADVESRIFAVTTHTAEEVVVNSDVSVGNYHIIPALVAIAAINSVTIGLEEMSEVADMLVNIGRYA